MKTVFLLLVYLFSCFCAFSSFGQGESNNIKNIKQVKTNLIFKNTLSDKYTEFAKMQESFGEEDDAKYFYKKAKKVLNGKYVSPEKIRKRDIEEYDLITLEQARSYLLQSVSQELMEGRPKKLADTIFFFDCWIVLQEGNKHVDSIDYCRKKFYKNLDELYVSKYKKKYVQQAQDYNETQDDYTNSMIVEKDVSQDNSIASNNNIKCTASVCFSVDEQTLYFPFDEEDLSSEAKYIIKQTAEKILNSGKQYKITLNGYADRMGSEEYNIRLSKERAISVKRELVKNNIDKKLIAIFAFGEMQGIMRTKDGMIAPENRSVQLVITTY